MIKDLVVHLDGSEADERRLAYAEPIAQKSEAYLTGLFVNEIPEVMVAGDPSLSAAQVVIDLQNEAIETGNKTKAVLEERLGRLSVTSELRRIDVYVSRAGAHIATEARVSDLFIALRPYGHPEDNMAATLETVLFDSGRPTLFVPPEGVPPENYDTIVLAWQDTREAARAVAAAMPFLAAAKSVVVVIVDEGGPSEQQGAEPGADIARHLDRHGVTVEVRHVEEWNRTSEAILNEVDKAGADMLVMGGYGHSRFREWILGGTTREILSKAGVPVLVTH